MKFNTLFAIDAAIIAAAFACFAERQMSGAHQMVVGTIAVILSLLVRLLYKRVKPPD